MAYNLYKGKNMNVVLDGNVATDTETGQTYTYGKRGRKPFWVQEFEASGAKEIPVSKTYKPKQQILDESKGPFEYHLISEMNNQCVIIANNDIDALMVANKNFKTPLSSSELSVLWKKKPYREDGYLVRGVWYMNRETNTWDEYKQVS